MLVVMYAEWTGGNFVKRHPGLQPLSHHHHHAMAAAKRLKMAGIQHKGYRLEDVREYLAAYWEPGGQAHFREEEEILLPVYAQYASPDHPLIAEMLLEHIQIRSLIQQILSQEPVTVEQMERLGTLLEEHVRKEEQVIFPLLEQAIPDEVLASLESSFHLNAEPESTILSIIQQRREITRFQSRAIERPILEKVLEAGYLSPTGNHLPSREFIAVTDRTMLDHLSRTTPYMPWLKEAAAAIVVTARPDVSKYWLQDASIACGLIWLTAVDLGLGLAFGAVYHSEDAAESERRENFVRQALSIPHDRRVVAILGLGYPAQPPGPKKPMPRETIIFYERFGGR